MMIGLCGALAIGILYPIISFSSTRHPNRLRLNRSCYNPVGTTNRCSNSSMVAINAREIPADGRENPTSNDTVYYMMDMQPIRTSWNLSRTFVQKGVTALELYRLYSDNLSVLIGVVACQSHQKVTHRVIHVHPCILAGQSHQGI